MVRPKHVSLAAFALLAHALSGCAPVNNPDAVPGLKDAMQLISAGHTGCQPAENELSSVTLRPDGSGQWNATCRGRVYLCTTFKGVNPSSSYSCAPAVP